MAKANNAEVYEIISTILNTPTDVLQEAFDRLRVAMVQQACTDYVICKRCQLGLTPDGEVHAKWGKISNTKKELDSIIEFFNGPDYRFWVDLDTYPDLNGNRILQRLDIIVEDTESWPVMGNIFKYGIDDDDTYDDIA